MMVLPVHNSERMSTAHCDWILKQMDRIHYTSVILHLAPNAEVNSNQMSL